MKKVSIITVNYNQPKVTEDLLHSIVRHNKYAAIEIIVVDNASNDESYAYLQPKFQQVKWILLPENLGFGKANNCGISEAKGKYCCFLNLVQLNLVNQLMSNYLTNLCHCFSISTLLRLQSL